jgi:hypothetical protein
MMLIASPAFASNRRVAVLRQIILRSDLRCLGTCPVAATSAAR